MSFGIVLVYAFISYLPLVVGVHVKFNVIVSPEANVTVWLPIWGSKIRV